MIFICQLKLPSLPTNCDKKITIVKMLKGILLFDGHLFIFYFSPFRFIQYANGNMVKIKTRIKQCGTKLGEDDQKSCENCTKSPTFLTNSVN